MNLIFKFRAFFRWFLVNVFSYKKNHHTWEMWKGWVSLYLNLYIQTNESVGTMYSLKTKYRLILVLISCYICHTDVNSTYESHIVLTSASDQFDIFLDNIRVLRWWTAYCLNGQIHINSDLINYGQMTPTAVGHFVLPLCFVYIFVYDAFSCYTGRGIVCVAYRFTRTEPCIMTRLLSAENDILPKCL